MTLEKALALAEEMAKDPRRDCLEDEMIQVFAKSIRLVQDHAAIDWQTSQGRIAELEQALNGLRSDYDLNNCRANTYQQALERIARECNHGTAQIIAVTALGRG